jgi:hypothetical protein
VRRFGPVVKGLLQLGNQLVEKKLVAVAVDAIGRGARLFTAT